MNFEKTELYKYKENPHNNDFNWHYFLCLENKECKNDKEIKLKILTKNGIGCWHLLTSTICFFEIQKVKQI